MCRVAEFGLQNALHALRADTRALRYADLDIRICTASCGSAWHEESDTSSAEIRVTIEAKSKLKAECRACVELYMWALQARIAWSEPRW